jgi:hypothetical protein
MADPMPASPATEEQESDDLHTIAQLVFPHLPLSVQAITLPALSKAWKAWTDGQDAKERTLQEADREFVFVDGVWIDVPLFFVPLWAAQQREQQLSDEQKRRFQLRAVAHGDVGAAAWFGVANVTPDHGARLCQMAARSGQLDALQWLRANGCG